jgi:hypothetical protein
MLLVLFMLLILNSFLHQAFFKMEAEMKLNDFTTALDSIRFLDDGDVVPLENSFEKVFGYFYLFLFISSLVLKSIMDYS